MLQKGVDLDGSLGPGKYNNWVERLGEFQLMPSDYTQNDGVERVYIDEYKDVGDGKLYKGQWNKKNGDRDGIGI